MSHEHPTADRDLDAFHRALTANLPDVAAFLLDADLRILLAEGEALQALSWFDAANYVGRCVPDLRGEIPDEILDLALTHYRAALEGERREFSLGDAGLDFSVVASPVSVESLGGAAIVVVARNVTAQRRTARELARSEQLQRTLSSNIPGTSVGLLDDQMRWVILEGEEVLRGLGARKEDIEGTLLGSSHGTLAGVVRPFVEAALAGHHGNVEWRSPDGHPYEIRIVPVTGVSGRPNALVAVTDVGERQETDVRVRRLTKRFEGAFDLAPTGMMLVELDGPARGTIVRANRALTQLLGYAEGELAGRSLLDIVHPDEHSWFAEQIGSLASGELDRLVVERRYLTATGHDLPVEISAAAIPDEGGRLGLAHVRDLTERRRAQEARDRAAEEHEQLQESLHQFQKLETVGQLAGGVAHDFNNLLGVILHSAAFALADLGDHPAAGEIREIEEAAKRAAELTRQLLTFGRQARSEPRPIDLAPMVERLVREMQVTLGQGVEVQLDLSEDSVVHSDPRQLELALRSIAMNAGEAMEGAGVLRIATRQVSIAEGEARRRGDRPGDYVELSVRDTGRGMSEEVRLRAIDPFFTTKEQATGAGLGLTTAYGIVKQNGGHLQIESVPGDGTDVRIQLPVARRDEIAPPPRTDVAPREGARVLVVEDEPSLRRVAERILTAGGYAVISAADGDQALRHAADADVVVTDIVMPGMSGTELAESIHAVRPEVPVVFMSGFTDRPARLPSDALFLAKPFTREGLLDLVSGALASAAR